ncbi:MAG: ABC transporter permease [Thermomicrobiales bacterium]|nr:ABC transporter permease [Thermomicrobiales bacterium]
MSQPSSLPDEGKTPARSRGDSWTRWLTTNPRVLVSGGFLLLTIVAALLAPVITVAEPDRIMPQQRFLNPGQESLLGTDAMGRDLFSRVVYGARLSLLVAFGSVAIALVVGTLFGVISGYFGSIWEMVLMRITDGILAFPSLLLAIFMVVFWGAQLISVVFIIGILYVPTFARVTYSSTLSVRASDFVLAARSAGAPEWLIMARYILPNIVAPIIVQLSLALGAAILLEASLSFLGLGPDIRLPSWGRSIQEGSRFLTLHPWGVVWPAIAISATVLALNVFGDALRDRLDPRLIR